jgi:hypothetical protein
MKFKTLSEREESIAEKTASIELYYNLCGLVA